MKFCEYGYLGPLCSCCIQGYARKGENSCVECSSQVINLISFCSILIAIMAFIFIMIFFSLRNSERLIRTKSGHRESRISNLNTSINMKILMNYVQMIAIVSNFKFQWPFYVRNYLNFFANVGGGISSNQVISFDCILYGYDIQYQGLFVQTIFVSILPFGICFFSGIVLILNYMRTKKSQTIRFIIIVIISSIFLQPTIIKALFDNISCKSLDNGNFLVDDMGISCDTDSYNDWVVLDKYIFI